MPEAVDGLIVITYNTVFRIGTKEVDDALFCPVQILILVYKDM